MDRMGGGTTDMGGGLAQSVDECVEWVGALAGGLSNIGRGLHAQGKIADAAEFAERALGMVQDIHGKAHPNVAIAANNAGAMH